MVRKEHPGNLNLIDERKKKEDGFERVKIRWKKDGQV